MANMGGTGDVAVLSAADRMEPVSYTHLDVYKRQAICDGGGEHQAAERGCSC